MGSLQGWVSEHKLASVSTVWASTVAASLAYARKRAPFLKPSLRLIHARIHAQALTLAVLSGAAVVSYYSAPADGAPEAEGSKPTAPVDLFDFDPIADW